MGWVGSEADGCEGKVSCCYWKGREDVVYESDSEVADANGNGNAMDEHELLQSEFL